MSRSGAMSARALAVPDLPGAATEGAATAGATRRQHRNTWAPTAYVHRRFVGVAVASRPRGGPADEPPSNLLDSGASAGAGCLHGRTAPPQTPNPHRPGLRGGHSASEEFERARGPLFPCVSPPTPAHTPFSRAPSALVLGAGPRRGWGLRCPAGWGGSSRPGRCRNGLLVPGGRSRPRRPRSPHCLAGSCLPSVHCPSRLGAVLGPPGKHRSRPVPFRGAQSGIGLIRLRQRSAWRSPSREDLGLWESQGRRLAGRAVAKRTARGNAPGSHAAPLA
jgi:hypothetical protein